MTVWVVLNTCCHEDNLVGVFSSAEKAQAWMDRQPPVPTEPPYPSSYDRIETRELDEELEQS